MHSGCKEQLSSKCPLGQCKVSVIPPTALNSIDSDGEIQLIPLINPQTVSTPTVWLVYRLLSLLQHMSLLHTDVHVEICVEVSGRRHVLRPAPVLCWSLSTLKVATIKVSSFCDASSSCWTRRRCSTWWTVGHTWGERERERNTNLNLAKTKWMCSWTSCTLRHWGVMSTHETWLIRNSSLRHCMQRSSYMSKGELRTMHARQN